jgi:hypothetical protein
MRYVLKSPIFEGEILQKYFLIMYFEDEAPARVSVEDLEVLACRPAVLLEFESRLVPCAARTWTSF